MHTISSLSQIQILKVRYHCKIFLQELVVLYLLVEIALTQSLTPVCVSLDDPGVVKERILDDILWLNFCFP